jgi:putative ATP-dependent endonuclease of OLD family
MTLHISRVIVENFRNFVHLELDPFPRSAVIVGENGIGKTNLLFAIRLVLDPNLPDARRQLRPEDISEYTDQQLADGVEVRVVVDLAGFDDDPRAKAELDGCIVAVEPFVARLTYLFRPLSGGDDDETRSLTIDDYEWLLFGGDAEENDARRVRRSITFSVLPALRDAIGDLALPSRSPLPELLEAAGPDPSALEQATESIDEVMTTLASDPALTTLADELSSRVVRMVGPQLDLVPTLGFASRRPTQLLRSIRLFVDQARSRTVADTSTGNANVVYLALLLERLALRLGADRMVATLLGVEEPEAHLHPGLQRHLFGYLLRQAPGLVLTTHSPHIAAVAPLQSIVLLGRDSETGGTVARSTLTAELTKDEEHDLERYLDVTRAEILFARVVVFVEGTAEMYLLPALARAAGFELDAHGVVVTSVSGTDFSPYRRLCAPNGLDVPNLVVTDGDRGTDLGYLGLARVARLLSGRGRRLLNEGVAALRARDEETDNEDDEEMLSAAEDGDESTDDEDNGDEPELITMASSAGIYVGSDTLEIDLVPLLADEMVAAYAELHSGKVNSFAAAVSRIAEGSADAADRQRVTQRIDRIGKGRYGQRLAGHIAGWPRRELRRRVLELAGEEADDWEETDVDDGILLSAGEPAYLLRALDRLSAMVRGGPLLPAEPGEEDDL